MTREIEILMMDGCTKAEAEKHLKNGSVVFEDFEECFEIYMEEWGIDEDELPIYKNMIESKKPITDWGIVNDEGKTFYISYVV